MVVAKLNGGARRLLGCRMQMAVAGAVGAGMIIGAGNVWGTDLDTITARVTAQFQGNAPSTGSVNSIIGRITANGNFTDSDYTNTAETNWGPLEGADEIDELAEYYSLHTGNTTVAADFVKTYDAWFVAHPTSTNWFDNDIAGPQQLGSAMVLAKSLLSTTEITEGLGYLNNANGNITSNSGQNIVDESIVEIDEAIVEQSSAQMTTAFNEIGTTLTVVGSGGSGIRADHTYQFHGPQLYIDGYGHSFISDVLNEGTLAVGTQYALTTTQYHTLVDNLLDGSQWFIRGDAIDLTADGRQVTYTSFVNSGTSFEGAIEAAQALGTYRSTELSAFLARQEATDNNGGNATSTDPLVGNRYFYSSEAMVNQRAAWYGSVKVTSTRTSQPEEGNDQGLENQFLGDGVNEIMITGNEYSGIEAAWNWYRLPGTTVEQNGNSLTINGVMGTGLAQLNPANDSGGGSFGGTHGTTAYAGGASDGMYGVTGFDYSNRFDVKAKKGYFFFDNEEVALGNSITSTSTTAEVDTTLNQCLMTDSSVKYEVSGNSTIQSLAFGAAAITPANLKWVYQGGVGYIFLTPVSNATIMAQNQTGNWANLNTANSGNVTQKVFTLYIDHGMAVNAGSYSYIEVPMTSSAGMDAYVAANPITVLRNDVVGQAVRQSTLDLTEATFYSAGNITMQTGQTIAVNNPSAILFKRSTNSIKVTAASPTASAFALGVTLAGVNLSGGTTWFDAFGNSTLTYNLPSGNFAGSSVGMTLTSDGTTNPTVTLVSDDQMTNSVYAVTGAVTLTGNTTFSEDSFASLTLSGQVSGGFSITNAGIGTLTLGSANLFGGGVNVNNGFVRVTNATGLGAGTTTVNTGGSLVISNVTVGTPIVLAGGTLGFSGTPNLTGNLTAMAGTTSKIMSADPQTPGTGVNESFTGTLMGSGNITLVNATGTISPDGGQAFRINASNASTFSGYLFVSNNVKGELFGNNAGVTTPGGTGTIVLTAGDAALGGSVNALTTTGGYSEFNLRNNSTGNMTFGNNVVVTGSGLALINPIGTAPVGATVTMGNLQIAGGQELGVYLASTFNSHPLIFTSVTLEGGTAKFSPKTNGFGASNSSGGDMYLGNISETTPGSGISMTGLKTLFLNGSSNAFTGGVSAISGALVFQPSPVTGSSTSSVAGITGVAPITISAGASVISDGIVASNLTINGASQVRLNGTDSGTSDISTLTLGGSTDAWTGSLDLTNNKLIVENTANHAAELATVKDMAAYGVTNSAGIFSSTQAAIQHVVVVDNAVAGMTSFGGQSVDAGSILVTSTVLGDANLDGVVDIQDLTTVANHWQQSVTDWSQGDFDGNGIVDILDLTAVANNWQYGTDGGGSGDLLDLLGAVQAVPEPGSMGLLALGGALVLRRRRR